MSGALYPTASGTKVFESSRIKVDYGNSRFGYMIVTCIGEQTLSFKLRLSKDDRTVLFEMRGGSTDTIPFIFGSGKYDIEAFAKVQSPAYARILKGSIDVQLISPDIVFRYPNQKVNYTKHSLIVLDTENTLKKFNMQTESEKMTLMYNWILNNFKYDTELARNVQPGYLPDPDRTLLTRKGICCDIAAMFAAMMRSQGILCKYVTGWVTMPTGQTPYHAYNEVYIDGDAKFIDGMTVERNKWTRLDLTLGLDHKKIKNYVGFMKDKKNYQDKNQY